MARPLTYTPALHRRIVAALKSGASLRDAVGYAGAEWPSFCRWLKAGRLAVDEPDHKEADPRFEQLARAVDQAVHASTVALIGLVQQQAADRPGKAKTKTRPAVPPRAGDWRAAQFLLEFRAEAPERRARARKLRAEAEVAEKRANGSLPPEKSEISGVNGAPLIPAPVDLRARITAIVARAARHAERRGAGGDDGGGPDRAGSGG